MLTCRKTYSDIPFAHRQHRHDGHCALIHGHNWAFTLTFACTAPDENGFVVDFGKLKFLRHWITTHLDHACVFNADDAYSRRYWTRCPSGKLFFSSSRKGGTLNAWVENGSLIFRPLFPMTSPPSGFSSIYSP